MDQLLAAWDRQGSPGLAVAVIKDGAVVYEAERGKSSQGDGSDFPAGARLAPGFELLEALEDASPATESK